LIYYNGSGNFAENSTSTVNLNQWNHIAMTKTSSGFALFVNGVGTTVFAINGTPQSNASFPLTIGQGFNTAINGYDSNLRIVKGTALYSGTTYTVPTAPLTAITNTALLTCQSNRFIDNSTNNAVITSNGSPTVQRFSPFNPTAPYSTSVIGGSGYFDGSGDYVTAPDSTALDLTADYTLEFWLYPTAQGVTRSLVCLGDGNSASGILLYWSIGDSRIKMYCGATVIGGSITTIPNVWTHVALVRSGSGSNNTTLYINGVVSGQATNNASFTGVAGNGFAIGAAYYGSYSEHTVGYFSNLRILNGTAAYTAAFTPPTAPVTNTITTSLLTNFTNAGIPDLAMQNNLETVGNAQVSTSVVKYGTGSLYFDGTGDYLVAPNNPIYAFNTGDFTMECWYYSGTITQQSLLDTRTTSNGPGVLMYTLNNILRVYSNGGDAAGSISISNNTWTHLVVERISGALYTYVNGVRDINGSAYAPNLTDNSFVAGYDTKYGGFGVNGYLDDIRITKGLGRYTGASFTPPTAALPTY
jgi:hypothetical protein